MAWVFVRLKLRMLKNRLGRSSVLALVGFVLIWVGTLAAGFGGAVLLAVVARVVPQLRDVLPILAFSLVAIGWVLGPLVTASLEDSLDPRKFESLPIGRSQLGIGLTVAGLAGPGGVATTIGLVGGSVAGYADPVSLLPIAATGLVAVLLVVVTARWLITLLADLLRSRRTREVATLVVGITMAIPGLLLVLFSSGGIQIEGSGQTGSGVLVWLPAGALGRSVVEFSAGDWAQGILGLVYGMSALAVIVWAYGRAIDRLQVTVGSSDRGRAVRGAGSFRPARIPLPSGRIGAIAAKELIYLRRDARVRGQMVGSLIAILVIGGVAFPVLRSEFGPFLAAPMAFFVVVALVVNQFGYDGGSFWGYVTTVPDMVDVLRGKNLAAAAFGIPVSALAAVVGAFIAGSWVYVPAAIISAVAVVAIWSAVGNVTSIIGPIRVPDANPFGSGGASGASFVASLVGLTAAGVLMVPVLAAVGLAAWTAGPWWAALAAVGSTGFAVGAYVLSFRITRPLMVRNTFSVMAVIDAE